MFVYFNGCPAPQRASRSLPPLKKRPRRSQAGDKRVLEYGVRAPAFYGNLREQTVFHENLLEACFVLIEISESLRKPPGDYGRM